MTNKDKATQKIKRTTKFNDGQAELVEYFDVRSANPTEEIARLNKAFGKRFSYELEVCHE